MANQSDEYLKCSEKTDQRNPRGLRGQKEVNDNFKRNISVITQANNAHCIDLRYLHSFTLLGQVRMGRWWFYSGNAGVA
mgnify:CR=1 FL=1